MPLKRLLEETAKVDIVLSKFKTQDLRSELNVKKQEKIDITTGSLKKILGRMPNWKSPSPDLVQGVFDKEF